MNIVTIWEGNVRDREQRRAIKDDDFIALLVDGTGCVEKITIVCQSVETARSAGKDRTVEPLQNRVGIEIDQEYTTQAVMRFADSPGTTTDIELHEPPSVQEWSELRQKMRDTRL